VSRQATEIKKGDLLEGYRVMAEIGQGAASVIYLVQDPKSKQIWALKHVERADAKDKRFLEQAESEVKIAKAVDHPNIRKIERIIKKTTGLLNLNEVYVVMEFVDGTSLDREPPKTIIDAVHIFHQVAAAMAHMHQCGYVHADMKPNNIVVRADMSVKIIDLGQSCKIGTVKPRIQGTPDFIAPEQVHRRPITGKTDIYNLGATMYYVLCKRHIPTALPKGDSLVGSLDDNLIEKPIPVRQLNPRVPQKLADLIMQCVEVKEENRPEHMGVVADRLNLIEGMLRARSAVMSEDGVGPAA
jgi:serine/threonine-protein kinase